jgi:uncharacterized protein (DUF2237 family)
MSSNYFRSELSKYESNYQNKSIEKFVGTKSQKNIFNTTLEPCCKGCIKRNNNLYNTGYYRDGFCSTDSTDHGTHVVCAKVDDDFLKFTKSKGNDLITPQANFPGLVDGDKWCLCALRWKEAYDAGKAPKIIGKSTNKIATKYIDKKILLNYSI